MRAILSWIVVLGLVAAPAQAGTGGGGDEKDKPADGTAAASKKDTAAKPAPSNLENELQQLRDLLEAQAKQLQAQNEQLKLQQQQMQSLEAELKSVNVTATNALTSNAAVTSNAGLAAASNALAVATGDGQSDRQCEPPTAIHIKGITLTPGGYFAAETVDRSKSIVDD